MKPALPGSACPWIPPAVHARNYAKCHCMCNEMVYAGERHRTSLLNIMCVLCMCCVRICVSSVCGVCASASRHFTHTSHQYSHAMRVSAPQVETKTRTTQSFTHAMQHTCGPERHMRRQRWRVAAYPHSHWTVASSVFHHAHTQRRYMPRLRIPFHIGTALQAVNCECRRQHFQGSGLWPVRHADWPGRTGRMMPWPLTPLATPGAHRFSAWRELLLLCVCSCQIDANLERHALIRILRNKQQGD
jgi:hypothetical protein